MEIIFWILTILSLIIQWIGEKLAMIFVRWWLRRIREHVANAIVASDFEVSLITGKDPLPLQFTFKLHNGSATTIQLDRLVLHLFCAGAHVGSVVGQVGKIPFIHTTDSKPRISKGRRINISIIIIPDIYLWFWLLPSGGFSLESSSVEISTIWGTITIPLSGNISTDIRERKKNIDDFVNKVRRSFGIIV